MSEVQSRKTAFVSGAGFEICFLSLVPQALLSVLSIASSRLS